ncbi:hypothetical protein [Streptomyces sp. NPDC047000]|uniref:hypothetical protein n=1 Tax=Streptomyces sp. NPDC047000 TaxID=3155474 RepID=UPI0033D1C884
MSDQPGEAPAAAASEEPPPSAPTAPEAPASGDGQGAATPGDGAPVTGPQPGHVPPQERHGGQPAADGAPAPGAGTPRTAAPGSAPAPEPQVSFEEQSAARERYNLLRTSRGAVNLGAGGHSYYVENMHSGDGGPQKSEVQAVPLPEDAPTATYAPVSGQDEMERALAEHRVIVLSGEEGTGRRATATALLTRCSRPHYAVSALYREDADVLQGVCEQAGRLFESGHGYLVEADARPVTARTLDRLGRLAVQYDVNVVVTARRSALADVTGDIHVVEHPGPDPMQVLEAHLREQATRHRLYCRRTEDDGGLPCDAGSARRFIARVTGNEQLRTTLGLVRSVTGVVQLARALAANVHATDEALSDVIGRWRDWLHLLAREMLGLDDDGRDEDRTPDPHHKAFRIAYALFNGHPLSDVVEAGELLSRIFLPHFGIAEDELVQHMAEQNIDRLVPQEMRASEATAADARNTARRALLVHEELLHSMLESTWDAYSRLRVPFLEWLDLLVGGRGPGRERVRVRVAQLVGLLMEHDFDFIYRECVGPWARSDSGVRRQCAALALEMAAAQGGTATADRVAARVQDWARSPGAALQDSAARSYGTSLGLRDVPATLAELGRLGRKPELVTSSSIAFSTAWLFLAGRVEEVMAELGHWASAQDEYLPRHAVRTLLALGRCTISADRTGRPALAELALDNDKNAELLVTFLNRALSTTETSTRAWNLLARWLPDADTEGNEDLAALYESLAPRIFKGRLLRNRTRFHVTWVWLPRHKNSRTLRRVLRALDTDPGPDPGDRPGPDNRPESDS